MKKVFFMTLVMLVVGQWGAKGQPDWVRFPCSDYLNWYVGDENYTTFLLEGSNLFHPYALTLSTGHLPQAGECAFNFDTPARTEECRIYGVATCLGPAVPEFTPNVSTRCVDYLAALPDGIENGLKWDDSVRFDIYELTEGEPIGDRRLVKSQVFYVSQGQRPDKVLCYYNVYWDYLRYYNSGQVPDTIRQYSDICLPIYEFYFDEPLVLSGTFSVSIRHPAEIHNSDPFHGEIPPDSVLFRGPAIATLTCHPGYHILFRSLFWNETNWSQHCPQIPSNIIPEDMSKANTRDLPNLYPIVKPKFGSVESAGDAGIVTVSPNPAKGKVKVTADCPMEEVTLVDAGGRELASYRCAKGQKVLGIDELPSQGVYVLRIVTEKGLVVKKLVVQ